MNAAERVAPAGRARAGRLRPGLLFAVSAVIACSPACGGVSGRFSESNARAHLNMLAGAIGSRPIGTDANRRARDYLIDQLRLFGFDVRVQDADASRPELGVTARVSNIIAVRSGARPDAVALVAHYDSAPEAPGATDDGLGVAVCLEAGRLLAARPAPVYSLVIAFTDGEEAGLLGAAALVTDPVFKARTRALINIDSIGSSGPSYLFETSAARDLVSAWASASPHPRGGSHGLEIYKRLPNDTDFTILRRLGVAGLNFAPVDDSYAYHTARDTPERVSTYTLRQSGENMLAIVDALDRRDLTTRAEAATYFDVSGAAAVAYSRTSGRVMTAAAFALGAIAWVRLFRNARQLAALGRLLFTAIWLPIGLAAAVGAMTAATWALRTAREAFHPWYADPVALMLLLLVVGVVTAWLLVRLTARLPRRFRASKNPGFIWCVTLPAWMALAGLMEWKAPGAAYLWTVPLLAAGVVLSGLPPNIPLAVRTGSIVLLGVTGTLWIPMSMTLIRFVVAIFGRMSIVTPAYVYAAIVGAAGLMLGPPFITVMATPERRLKRPSVIGALLMVALAVTAGLAYVAPAYDFEHPARRHAQFVQDGARGRSHWEIGGLEPGLDVALVPGVPRDWRPTLAPIDTSVPSAPVPAPFRFVATGEGVTVPGSFSGRLRSVEGRAEIEVTGRAEPPASILFVMPPGVMPSAPNLPGILRGARWIAQYVAPPPEGVAFRATIAPADIAKLGEGAVILVTPRLPGGVGWQGLMPWMPLDQTVWSVHAVYIQPLGTLLAADLTPAGPSPPLR